MRRRDFIKAMGAMGVTTVAPSLFTNQAFISRAEASPDFNSLNVDLTNKRAPQVINIFLYGGASELAGNLTSINDLETHSQSRYNNPNMNPIFTTAYDEVAAQANPNADVGQVTPNHFWANAGGIIMEDMLAEGDMTVYRTCNRRKNNTRAHRPSIFSGQKGTLDIDSAPGLGTTLASVIAANRTTYESEFGKTLEELVMPMVSFEGESTTFAPDPNATTPIPLVLKPVGLSATFANPYQRNQEPTSAAELDYLVDTKMKANPDSNAGDADFDDLTADYGERYKKVSESFLNARKLATIVAGFNDLVNNPDSLPLLPERDVDGSNPDFDILLYEAYLNAVNNGTGRLFEQNTTINPDDAAYATYTPVALSPIGNGLDTTWVQVPDPNSTAIPAPLIWEYQYLDLNGVAIADPDNDPRLQGTPGENRLVYPANNQFATLLRAAVTLCVHNPDTKLAMVGSPGLGGWDDHNSAMTEYENRMQTLMSAVRAAVKHIKYSIDDPTVLAARGGQDTSNIIINIFTDFGRNANLNNSQGWDHGNTQNLYTFGGRPFIRDPDWVPANSLDTVQPVKNAEFTSTPSTATSPRPSGALGKIVGYTNIFGTSGQNRLFTKPAEPSDLTNYATLNTNDGVNIQSYEFEPQAIAATIYNWFGVDATGTMQLTKNDDDDFTSGTIDRMGSDGNGTLVPETVNRSAGEPPIDENVDGVFLNPPLTIKNIPV